MGDPLLMWNIINIIANIYEYKNKIINKFYKLSTTYLYEHREYAEKYKFGRKINFNGISHAKTTLAINTRYTIHDTFLIYEHTTLVTVLHIIMYFVYWSQSFS